jgi:RNA-directed DNA polymerase
VRYADDFIVTSATRQLLEQKVKPALTDFLQQRGLQLSEQKTVITPIQTGFNFLGHTVRKYGVKLLITPAKSKIKQLRVKISKVIQSALGRSQVTLLRQLNPLLRGWANYCRNGAAKGTFQKLDYYVWRKIRRWISRRHSDKPTSWKKRNYFSAAGKDGVFSARLSTPKGESRVLKLHQMGRTKIERHIKVQGAANPYDPKYTEYFDKRRRFAWRIRGGDGQPFRLPFLPDELDYSCTSFDCRRCPRQAHRLEWLEPYERKLSSTVLRGGRAGNSPLPLGVGIARWQVVCPFGR